jgi:hypothetical protein
MIINEASNNASEYAEGSFCPLGSVNTPEKIKIGGTAITVVYHTHIGFCVREYENNYYEDSNFMMVVWDPINKRANTICFATTRFYCGLSFGSCVDASPEVIAEYEAWKIKADRRCALLETRKFRAKLFEQARLCNISLKQLQRLNCVYGSELMIELLKIRKFRSAFRESLAKQVRLWLTSESKFSTPLSPKQIDCLVRF